MIVCKFHDIIDLLSIIDIILAEAKVIYVDWLIKITVQQIFRQIIDKIYAAVIKSLRVLIEFKWALNNFSIFLVVEW